MKNNDWVTCYDNQPFLVQFVASIGSTLLDIFVIFMSKGDTTNIALYALKDNKLHYLSDGDVSVDMNDTLSLLDCAKTIIEACEKEILDFIAKIMDYDSLER